MRLAAATSSGSTRNRGNPLAGPRAWPWAPPALRCMATIAAFCQDTALHSVVFWSLQPTSFASYSAHPCVDNIFFICCTTFKISAPSNTSANLPGHFLPKTPIQGPASGPPGPSFSSPVTASFSCHTLIWRSPQEGAATGEPHVPQVPKYCPLFSRVKISLRIRTAWFPSPPT